MQLAQLLLELTDRGATDLHLVVDQRPAFRVDGMLVRGEEQPVTEADLDQMFVAPLATELADRYSSCGYLKLSMRNGDRRFLCQLARERGQTSVVLTALPRDVPSIDELVDSEEDMARVLQVMQFKRGLVFITGLAGSGRSSLCAAMVETINRSQPKRIITIESPIEFDLVSKQSLITQQMVGHDFECFTDALSATLGSRADIVYISELKDFGSFEAACKLAESGQLVITTFNQPTIANAVKNLSDAYPGNRDRTRDLLVANLQAIIATQLIPRVGSRKRVGAYEVLIGTVRAKGVIQEGKWDLMNVMRESRNLGMQPMDDSLLRLYESKTISYDEARYRMLAKDMLPEPKRR